MHVSVYTCLTALLWFDLAIVLCVAFGGKADHFSIWALGQ